MTSRSYLAEPARPSAPCSRTADGHTDGLSQQTIRELRVRSVDYDRG